MSCIASRSSGFKLSICITTLNRASFIGATLDSILHQLTNDCEIVVLDAASTDDTESVVSEYARRCSRLRYVKQAANHGLDRDYDRVVELARGEYCWLMTDDDLLKPDAVAMVLSALSQDVSLVVVNVESRDLSMSTLLQRRWVEFDTDRVYRSHELDRLFVEADQLARYVGCMIIKRSIWLARERQRYYGSWFLFAGVIFQAPLPGDAILIAKPLISYRMSNVHSFRSLGGQILLSLWPSLVASLPLSKAAVRKVPSAQPWRHLEWLLFLRAMEAYSLPEYRQWIRPQLHSIRERTIPFVVGRLPGEVANALLTCYYSFRPHGNQHWLKDSRFHWRKLRIFRGKLRSRTADVTIRADGQH